MIAEYYLELIFISLCVAMVSMLYYLLIKPLNKNPTTYWKRHANGIHEFCSCCKKGCKICDQGGEYA